MPPPVLYALALGFAFTLDYLWPLRLWLHEAQAATGLGIMALGLGIGMWAMITFVRAGTNVPTHKPATTIITHGPYRYSRNPIYIGLNLLYIGLSVSFGAIWLLAVLPALLWVMRRYVIAREEIYLERKFGAAYTGYKNRVRRWL